MNQYLLSAHVCLLQFLQHDSYRLISESTTTEENNLAADKFHCADSWRHIRRRTVVSGVHALNLDERREDK